MFGFIIRPLIRKELKKMAKEYIQPVLTFLRDIGLKSGGLVTILGLALIGAMAYYEKGTDTHVMWVGIVTVVFGALRIFYSNGKIKESEKK